MSNETIRHVTTVFPIDPEALKPNPKHRRRVSIIKDFSLNTSTHGIPGIARSESIQNRLFWITSLLIFAGIMTYFIVQSIRAYFEYPSQTSISIVVEWPQAFPAVTVCNYSPLRYDQFIGPFLNYLSAHNLTNKTNTSDFTIQQSMYIQDFLIYKLNQDESLNNFFYSLESMMMRCSYNGRLCSVTNFTWFISSAYGLCYTFNAKLKNDTDNSIRYNADFGGNGLFQLYFYVHQHQYVPYVSNGIGMVVMVHDNTQLPTIELAAMQLAPGRHHKLSYMKRTSLFLSAPYTTCNDKLNLGMQVLFDQYNGTDYGYSQYQCFVACIQAYTYAKCSCGSPFRWAARYIVLPGTNKAINITFCDIRNSCYIEATTEIMNTHSIWRNYCPDCTQECSFSDFIIKSSSVLAPPKYLLNEMKRFVESSKIPLPENWSTSWISEIQSSYVSLEVAYETTRSEIYSQQATISPTDVVSNVGGQTGLWIGISFLSLMELAEMLYRLLRYQCYGLRRTIRKRFRSQETDNYLY